jgi:hypothetical protein
MIRFLFPSSSSLLTLTPASLSISLHSVDYTSTDPNTKYEKEKKSSIGINKRRSCQKKETHSSLHSLFFFFSKYTTQSFLFFCIHYLWKYKWGFSSLVVKSLGVKEVTLLLLLDGSGLFFFSQVNTGNHPDANTLVGKEVTRPGLKCEKSWTSYRAAHCRAETTIPNICVRGCVFAKKCIW